MVFDWTSYSFREYKMIILKIMSFFPHFNLEFYRNSNIHVLVMTEFI